MPIANTVTRYAGNKLARRLGRSIPWIGAAVALATLGSAVRQKGWIRGAVHTALDAIPYVGGAKNLAEMARGRDFLRDKPRPPLDASGAPVTGAASRRQGPAPVPLQASSRR